MRSCPVTSQSQISRTRPGNSIFQVMVNFIKALRSQFTSLESHLTKIIFTAYPARVVNNDHRVFVRLDNGFDFISEKANRGLNCCVIDDWMTRSIDPFEKSFRWYFFSFWLFPEDFRHPRVYFERRFVWFRLRFEFAALDKERERERVTRVNQSLRISSNHQHRQQQKKQW